MLKLTDFLSKTTIDFVGAKYVGQVVGFACTHRLKKLLYIVTDKDIFVDYKKMTIGEKAILSNIATPLDNQDMIIFKPNIICYKNDGNDKETAVDIEFDKYGNLLKLYTDKAEYQYKDIYNAGSDLIILQSEIRKKPPTIPKPKKDSKVSLIKPTDKSNVVLKEIYIKDRISNDNSIATPSKDIPHGNYNGNSIATLSNDTNYDKSYSETLVKANDTTSPTISTDKTKTILSNDTYDNHCENTRNITATPPIFTKTNGTALVPIANKTITQTFGTTNISHITNSNAQTNKIQMPSKIVCNFSFVINRKKVK